MTTGGRLPLVGADPYAPRDLHLVGRYALGVNWQDGHGSIYPFTLLRQACACPACQAGAGVEGGAEAPWPAEIRREPQGVLIRWQGGHETPLAYPVLRAACRCASCAKRTP